MTRKRARGRQHRDKNISNNTYEYTGSHRTTDWNVEFGSLPSTSTSWYRNFDRKSLYRDSFLSKSSNANKRRQPLRPMLVAVLLKTIPFVTVLFAVSLTLPKLTFDAARYLTMSRPTVLYGSPTDWNDVVGCLSRTHRRDVRDHFGAEEDTDIHHHHTHLPLNPDVVWNWSRYSSSRDYTSGANQTEATTVSAASMPMSIPRRRLLIAQYSGKGSYQKLLEEVEPINRAYAKRWGHDYTTLVGTALKFPGLMYETSQNDSASGNDDHKNGENHRYCRHYAKNDDNNGPNTNNSSSAPLSASQSYYNYEAQSTFNKIPLLFKAMEESPRNYDQVLILDSDTMIVDFEYDITSLLLSSNSADQEYDDMNDRPNVNNPLGNDNYVKKSDENASMNDASRERDEERTIYNNQDEDADHDYSYFLVAYRVWKFDWLSTWDVNAGITLWNLRHPNTRLVAEDWLKSSLSDPKQVLLKNDDQYYLQRSLQKVPASSTFSNDVKTNSLMDSFGMRSFQKWWKEHSFWPALLNYYCDSNSSEIGGFSFAGSTGTGRCSDHVENGVGIRTVREEFEYYNATLIKHFKRDTASWSRTGLEQRLSRIREAKAEVCRLWPKDCLAAVIPGRHV